MLADNKQSGRRYNEAFYYYETITRECFDFLQRCRKYCHEYDKQHGASYMIYPT